MNKSNLKLENEKMSSDNQSTSYSRKISLVKHKQYSLFLLLTYGLGDLTTHYLAKTFTALQEQNIFQQSIMAQNDWLVYAILIKVIIIILVIGLAYWSDQPIVYKIGIGFGIYVTCSNLLGIVYYYWSY